MIVAAETTQDLLNPLEASASVAHQITFLCRRLDARIRVALIENDHEIPSYDSPDFHSKLLHHITDVLNTAISKQQYDITIALLVALQTLMREVCAGWAKLDDSTIKETRLLMWKLINTLTDSAGAEVPLEACNVLRAGLEAFYPSAMERSAFLMLLLSEGESNSSMTQLLDLLLNDLAEHIRSTDPGVTVKGRYL